MDYIKRLNLSFDMRREKDRQVCDILSVIKHKTAYVTEAVLAYELKKYSIDDKDMIKQALREVLEETNIKLSNENVQEREEKIPQMVFDIFEQM
ncbi:MAG: hypothetical protein PWP27_1822 [Clostridiales bacterium]|jgi:peroxiredoxin|nr:hypothetical protein [Clostridiales bacterium]MDK2934012.1 hypothetical protein [Clostridiales bacterium]